MSHLIKPSGPPYISTTLAVVGGHPTIHTDIPICAVLIAIYFTCAMLNLRIFKRNVATRHKFLISWALLAFCMSRVVTMALRIGWAAHPSNARLTIAAQIFTSAGVLVEYLVVLVLVIRVFRARRPRWGWNGAFRLGMKIAYGLLLGALLVTVAFTVLSFYTLDGGLRKAALWVQRCAILYMLLFNVLSAVLLLLSVFAETTEESEDFGTGSMGSKQRILGTALFFLLFIVGFRMGTAWSDARPASEAEWWHSKEAFYIIMFGCEIAVVVLFLVMRIDRRFWVPNGSDGPGDYSMGPKVEKEEGIALEDGTGKPEEEEREGEVAVAVAVEEVNGGWRTADSSKAIL